MKPFSLTSLRLVLLFLILTLLAACSKTYSWNQKLTVTVMTPAGEVSASSVVEVTKVSSTGKFILPEARGVKSKLRGEAVVLEVTPGKYLFVLLDGVDDLAHFVFPQIPYEHSSEFGRWARQIAKHRGSGIVPREKYPLMVTFEDAGDPASVRSVNPDDLASRFGPGVSLAELTLDITDEPTTRGPVERVLSWWPTFRSGPRNSMSALRMPNDSPRGWRNLEALRFWSLDRIQEFNEENQ